MNNWADPHWQNRRDTPDTGGLSLLIPVLAIVSLTQAGSLRAQSFSQVQKFGRHEYKNDISLLRLADNGLNQKAFSMTMPRRNPRWQGSRDLGR